MVGAGTGPLLPGFMAPCLLCLAHCCIRHLRSCEWAWGLVVVDLIFLPRTEVELIVSAEDGGPRCGLRRPVMLHPKMG